MRSLTLQFVVTATVVYVASSTFISDVGKSVANAKGPPSSEVLTFALKAQIGVACKSKKQQNIEVVDSTDRVENCGEDAYFVSSKERVVDSKYISFGIADGVGGWSDFQGHPSAFSKALCAGARHSFIDAVYPHPLRMMKQGYENVLKGGDKNAGGSTALFLVMDCVAGHLETANLGDSGYLIIRNGKVIFQSLPQTIGFNFPFQLSLSPSFMKIQGATEQFDCDHSCLASHNLSPGDVIIVASDGLFDNMFEDDIVAEYEVAMSTFYDEHPTYYEELQSWWIGTAAQPPKIEDKASQKDVHGAMIELSYALTYMANDFAHDETTQSPFSKVAQKAGYRFEGGKVDDITVIALYVHAV